MSIPLLTNFTINQNAPIDSRLVVTSSSARDSITYKYDGLTVFKTDDRTSWTYNAITATWSQNSGSGVSGIYGGSGTLIGDTYVFTGLVSNSAGSSSKKFILSASSSPSNNIYFSSYFNRTVFGSTWPSVEYRMQYSYDSNTSNNVFISMNPLEPIANLSGGIDIGTSNVRRFTITSNGIVRLWSPTYSSDFNTSNLTANRTYNLPNNSGTLALTSDVNLISATVSLLSASVSNIGTTVSVLKNRLDSQFYKNVDNTTMVANFPSIITPLLVPGTLYRVSGNAATYIMPSCLNTSIPEMSIFAFTSLGGRVYLQGTASETFFDSISQTPTSNRFTVWSGETVIIQKPSSGTSWNIVARFNEIEPGLISLKYGSPSLNSGWAVCNGSAVSTTDYPRLFAKIGYAFGGSGTSFNLPLISPIVVSGNTIYYYIKV